MAWSKLQTRSQWSWSSVLVDWSMPSNFGQFKIEQDNSDTKDSKSCPHHAMWAQESSKSSEAHWILECGSLSVILYIKVTIDSHVSWYQHLINMYCILSCVDLNTQLSSQINAGSYLKIQIVYGNLLLVFTISIFFDSHTLNLLELQYTMFLAVRFPYTLPWKFSNAFFSYFLSG